ncbi:hypothetical protein HDU93_004173 [Gonapodya sp. JEL0774]|nr:hypothetical protein HDU93_004173 [Gonapodya sp. JEL0774]
MEQHPCDRHLLAAIEEGRVDEVEEALRSEADVGARKMVTIRCVLAPNKTMRRRSIFNLKDVKEEPKEVRSDTRQMESAIALAIRSYSASKAEIVRKLLEAGCNPNDPIEWSIPNYCDRWTEEQWTNRRWNDRESFQYPAALDLALTGGQWNFNKFGAHVTTNNPSSPEDVCDNYYLTPNLQIVELLLEHGAKITDSVLERARDLRDGKNSRGETFAPRPGFLVLLESRLALQRRSMSSRSAQASPRHSTPPSPNLPQQQQFAKTVPHRLPSPPVIPVYLPHTPRINQQHSEFHNTSPVLPSPARSRRSSPTDGDGYRPSVRSASPANATKHSFNGHRRAVSQAPNNSSSNASSSRGGAVAQTSQTLEEHVAIPASASSFQPLTAPFTSPSAIAKPAFSQGGNMKGQGSTGTWSTSSDEMTVVAMPPTGWSGGNVQHSETIADLARRNEFLKVQLASIDSANRDLSEKLERRNSRIAELKMENAALREYVQEMDVEIGQERRKVAGLELEVKDQAQTIQALQAQLERVLGAPSRTKRKSRVGQ